MAKHRCQPRTQADNLWIRNPNTYSQLTTGVPFWGETRELNDAEWRLAAKVWASDLAQARKTLGKLFVETHLGRSLKAILEESTDGNRRRQNQPTSQVAGSSLGNQTGTPRICRRRQAV